MFTEVKLLEGKPVIFVNGEPHHSIFCSMDTVQMKTFINAGFNIFDTHPYTFSGWVGENQYDYTLTDQRIESFLNQKKDALLIIRFWMEYEEVNNDRWNAKGWWTEQNQDQCTKACLPDACGKRRAEPPSFASLKWRNESGEALKRVIEHIESKYGENIFAYIPGGGPCGEWLHWHTYDIESNKFPVDYSKPMLHGFIQYLRDTYEDDINLLNDRWKSNHDAFENVSLPKPEQRFTPSFKNLRDPSKERQVLDYYEYFNRIVSDTLLYWCQIAKEACNRQKIIMAFYGYHWVGSERFSLTRSGHIHLKKVLESVDVDMIVAPYIYDFREMGGVVSSQTVAGSVRKAGKLLLVESDPATCLKSGWTYNNHIPTNIKESLEVMKRDTVYALTKGSGLWYMDDVMSMEELAGGRYEHPEIIKGLSIIRSIAEKYSVGVGESCAEIAVILHDRSSFYFKEGDPFQGPLVNMFKVWELERMGAPFDDYLLSDLKEIDADRYKVFIIPNAVYLSDLERKIISEKCCRDDKTVIWCYAAGALSDNGLNIEKMQELTGIKIGYTMEPGEVVVELSAKDDEYLEGLRKGMSYGTNGSYLDIDAIKEQASVNCYPGSNTGFNIAPRFWAQDADAETLGFLKGTEKQGLVIKKMPGWTSVFSSAPMIPKEVLRNAARMAGCHIFTNFLGQTMSCRNFFGFYAHQSGDCRIKLPFKTKVVDVFTGEILAEASEEIDLQVKENTTYFLNFT